MLRHTSQAQALKGERCLALEHERYTMGFREEFFFPHRTYAQISLERTVADGFRAEREEFVKLRQAQKAEYEAVAAAVDDFRGELTYQAERIGCEIAEGSARIVEAVEQGSADIVSAIQRTCDY